MAGAPIVSTTSPRVTTTEFTPRGVGTPLRMSPLLLRTVATTVASFDAPLPASPTDGECATDWLSVILTMGVLVEAALPGSAAESSPASSNPRIVFCIYIKEPPLCPSAGANKGISEHAYQRNSLR